MTDQPRLLDAYRRSRQSGGPAPLPDPSTTPTEDEEPPWTMMAGVLALAGWESKVRLGRRIWRDPSDPFNAWFSEEMAYLQVERGDQE